MKCIKPSKSIHNNKEQVADKIAFTKRSCSAIARQATSKMSSTTAIAAITNQHCEARSYLTPNPKLFPDCPPHRADADAAPRCFQ